MADGSAHLPQVDKHQVALALGVSNRAAEMRAAREGWLFAEVPVRGGRRRLYDVAALPSDVREAIRRHSAIAAASALDSSQQFHAGRQLARRLELRETVDAAVQLRTVQNGAADAAGLTGKRAERMHARLDILGRLDAFATRRRLGICRALQEFCAAYAAGTDLKVPDQVRAVIGSDLAPISLRRWRKTLKEQGAAALGGAYGNRAGTGTIESTPALRDFAIGVIAEKPHISQKMLFESIGARFGDGTIRMPSYTAVKDFVARWKRDNASAFQALTNPDAWKNRRMAAFGSLDEGVVRANQLWMLDSTPGDLQLLDGRYTILGAVDVASRRAGLHLSKTSSAEAVCGLLRRQILAWGVPEAVKMDNGRDYAGTRVGNALVALGVEARYSAPFSPWEKGNVERLFRTLSHGLIELLPGYLGHNVAEQQEIRARQSFAERMFKKNAVTEIRLTATEFQGFLDRWCRDFYEQQAHEGLKGLTPFEKSAQLRSTVRLIGDERALDLLLAEGGSGVVTKKGLRANKLTYIAPDLAGLIGERVRWLHDEDELGRVVVYHNDAFVCVAECPEVMGVSRREIAIEAKAKQTRDIADKRRELRALGRKADTTGLAFEILDKKQRQAASLAAMPAPNVVHLTPALEAASQAVAALDAAGSPPPLGVTTLADVAAESRALRRDQVEDDTAETRFRAALEVLLIPEAERNDIQRVRLKRAMDTNDFQARWMVFTDFGPSGFGLSDTYLALMPEGALYHRFREAQLIQGD